MHFFIVVSMVPFMHRLHMVGKLPLTLCLFSMSVHVTKLSLLFPCAHSPSPLTSSLLPCCSTFITSFLILRLVLADRSPHGLSWVQLMVYSVLLFVGLLLSVDTILSPIWASLTHSLPSNASLLGNYNSVILCPAAVCNDGLKWWGSGISSSLI